MLRGLRALHGWIHSPQGAADTYDVIKMRAGGENEAQAPSYWFKTEELRLGSLAASPLAEDTDRLEY